MSSVPAYNRYAEEVPMPGMDQAALAEIKALEAAGDTENPRYMEVLNEHHYVRHVLRLPLDDWPDPVRRAFGHHEPEHLCLHARAERARHQRRSQAARLGP